MGTRDDILLIADELRAIADLGLHYAIRDGRSYDRERYERTLALSARLLALADSRSADEILREYGGDLSHVCPKLAADAALFDDRGRILLMRRADSGLWCIPGGMVNVGETAAEAAAREMREEVGLIVRPQELVGVFDNRFLGLPVAVQAYHLVFVCDYVSGEPTLSHEATDVGYFAEDALPPLHPDHGVKVPVVFEHQAGRLDGALFDGR